MLFRRVFTFVAMLLAMALPSQAETLDHIEKRIEAGTEIQQISTEDLARAMAKGEAILFDVRADDEFAVSRIPGAIRLDPTMDAKEFLAIYGPEIMQKKAVFYCSVGRRSTAMAERVAEVHGDMGHHLYNLRGGIFRWHGEKRHLVNAQGDTDFVHPYNWFWKRVTMRPKMTRYKPAID